MSSISSIRFIFLLCLFPAGSLFLFGQEGESGVSGEFRLITVSRIGTDLYYYHNEEYVRCEPRLNRFSESYRFSLDAEEERRLPFFRKVVRQNSEGEEVVNYEPMGSARMPGSGAYILMLNPVYKDPKQPYEITSLRFGILPDELQDGEAGVWYFVNLTETPIFAKLGMESEPVRIGPDSREKVRVETSREYDIMQFAARMDGEAKVFHSTAWPVYEDTAYLVLFTKRSGSDRISVLRMGSK